MAFLFLNRYLDLSEAIEDADGGGAALSDNTDFEGTDIPSPFDIPLPETNCLPAGEQEEIREWVLQVSMDTSIDKTLSTFPCEQCGNGIYEANLACHYCQNQWEACVVSGYPVTRAHAVECSNCHKKANRGAWNMWVGVTNNCAWCGAISHTY